MWNLKNKTKKPNRLLKTENKPVVVRGEVGGRMGKIGEEH